ncbi:MAG: methyltransferase domain-containing protein [Candidatus Gracilibacteria bacterium]|jgi:ribosomal protein L11 methylase PrmA
MLIIVANVLVLVVTIILLYYVTSGAPYLPTTDENVLKMVKFASMKRGQKILDVGSGDGRIVIAFAKAGAEAHGFEINPILVWMSRRNIKRAGLQGKAFIHFVNFWKRDFSPYDLVIVYQITHLMKKFQKKFEKELRPGTKILCNSFFLPDWKEEKKDKPLFLYTKMKGKNSMATGK